MIFPDLPLSLSLLKYPNPTLRIHPPLKINNNQKFQKMAINMLVKETFMKILPAVTVTKSHRGIHWQTSKQRWDRGNKGGNKARMG